MRPESLLLELLKANHHRDGLRCLRLFDVEPDAMDAVREEASRLVQDHSPSDIMDRGHVTNWTNPYGDALQFSLFNTSGSYTDTSTDHDYKRTGKRLVNQEEFPAIARLFDAFPDAYNLRMNVLGRKSGLSPHEEHIDVPKRSRWQRGLDLRIRLHLPVLTNPRARVLLDGDLYRFEAGGVYLFNNGCIHSARNDSDEPRIHLVWDVLVTQRFFDLAFGPDAPTAGPLHRTPAERQALDPVGTADVRDYATSGRGRAHYERLRLGRLGIRPQSFQSVYNSILYARRRMYDRPRLAAPPAE